jgi:phospholipid/cholesterol/gamma-HCH transport system permease protein
MPRILGVTLSVFFLTFYFQFVAIFGGLFLSSILIDAPLLQQLRNVFEVLTFQEIGVSALKGLIFGLLISGSSCFHGLRVRHSITEIPQTTTAAVMQSLFFIFIFDGLITVVSM